MMRLLVKRCSRVSRTPFKFKVGQQQRFQSSLLVHRNSRRIDINTNILDDSTELGMLSNYHTLTITTATNNNNYTHKTTNYFSSGGTRRYFSTANSSDDDAIEQFSDHIANSSNIVVMAGAGMSVSAGIPDFRTPGTGVYENLQKYDLPYPEAIFELGFFRDNPAPFYDWCKCLWPGSIKPTYTHYFLKLLHEQGKLRRCFTQNIDTLETTAGLPRDKVVGAHGNMDGASCIDNGQAVPIEELEAALFVDDEGERERAWMELSVKYGGLVKPDIVFFGEQLPQHFFERSALDLPSADLLIVVGTSLQVFPFAGLVDHTTHDTPRVLVNRDEVGNFNREKDMVLTGDSDALFRAVAGQLGWADEMEKLVKA